MNITPFPAGNDFKIDFSTSEKGNYKIGLFNIQGSEILSKNLGLINKNRAVDLSFDAHLLPAGTYFVVLYFNGLIADNKLLLLIK